MAFDREELEEEYEDDTETLARMVEIFDRDCQQRLLKMREAIAAQDSEVLMNEAHALKGGLGNFFADESFQTAFKLEIMGRDSDLGQAAEALALLESELQTFRRAIGEMLGE